MHGHNRLMKKAIGWVPWDSTDPTAMVDASVVTSKDLVKSESVRVVREAIASFSCWNEVAALEFHSKELVRRR